ncbi:ABC transporter ATP-binding protein [Sinanaerobacter chloroacetimidivorans]|uniref:ABC transporter ATP-binding protein n=1 Tax=Sinanaerobacter chloroacetimidivorans TaxID=2818044 RepID=A0A8J7VYC7_9FIRM|nr:ABC transporter ATP-binding protein [Sinanaerobacter chloroacetimidivorans]MBR0597004.1 ABC transporter ATP-binding protein [Sinanaerobacter chloroacetimidivorans]
MSDEKKQPVKSPMGGGPMGGAMGRPTEKAKDFKGTLKRLVRYLEPQKMRFFAVGILAVVSTVFSIFGPKVLGKATTKIADGVIAQYAYIAKIQAAVSQHAPEPVIDGLRKSPIPLFDFGYIGRIMILMIFLYVISCLCSYAMSFIMSGVSQRTVFIMRNEVKEKLDRLPLKYFDGRTHGEILSRVTNDMDNIATTLQQSLTQLITSLVTIIGILIMMLSISPLMTLIALVTLPACGILTVFIAKKSQIFFARQQKSLGELNGHVEEMYTGHKIVKVFGHEKESIEQFRRINEQLYHAGWKAQFMSGVIMPALNFVNNLGYVFICIIGGLLVAKKAIEIGDIQAFIQYMRQFTQPIVQTANIANIIQGTIASAERVFEVLDEEEQIPDPVDNVRIEKGNITGKVDFEHVSFRYKEDVPLIEDMNIHVNPGQMIAIVGPTGAGKTTMINLLLRFYELNGGRITIDGIDITKMTRGDLRGLFGMVLQDTWLYKGTILENIGYGLENPDPEKIIEAAKAAHADHFIRSLPLGYDTILNEEASNISQGQKQLITIARALLADPPILILDEATSSVDTRTEALIQKAMKSLMEGRTSFVIAHRLSTIKNADLILVMKNGTVIEQGTHDELMKRKGFYEDLYNSQFAKRFDAKEEENE